MRIGDVDAVAYTRGPGMYGCLSVAAGAAKALAASAKKPIFGIHHMVSLKSRLRTSYQLDMMDGLSEIS